jgi:single-strand DNA-binding protein
MKMAGINVVVLSGNLTRDPELKALPSGTAVCDLGLAVNGYVANKGPKVDFFDVTCFGKVAEAVAQYLTKGSHIAISGRLEQQRWENKDGQKRTKIKVVADRIEFPSKGKGNGANDDDTPF